MQIAGSARRQSLAYSSIFGYEATATARVFISISYEKDLILWDMQSDLKFMNFHVSVQKLNQNNFNNAIANGTTLVDFYADWCGPCRMVSPIVDEIAEERSDITVGKVNVDDENALAMKYGVMSIPTLIVFKDGKEKTRIDN